MTVSEEEVRMAMRTIVNNPEAKALKWAIDYAYAGTRMSGDVLMIQARYVLGNITHWRGEEAKSVRATLKAYTRG